MFGLAMAPSTFAVLQASPATSRTVKDTLMDTLFPGCIGPKVPVRSFQCRMLPLMLSGATGDAEANWKYVESKVSSSGR